MSLSPSRHSRAGENPEQLITDNLDIWTAAIQNKASTGRGSNKKQELYGIKKLRELILELAVRGLLVPQDPNDEPASVLLEKIAAEKERLIKEEVFKKPKKLPPIADEDRMPDLPKGWADIRLGELLRVLNGRAYKKHEMLQEGTPLLRVGNLFTSNEWYYSDLELEPDKYINDGDLIYAWSASFGPFIWNSGKAIYHYHIWKLDFFHQAACDKNYLFTYLQAITDQIKASGSGIAMIHMTKDRMEKLVIPFPPITEQSRIVAKVDELMALCDQLEQQTESSLNAHQTLVETLLKALLNAAQSRDDRSSKDGVIKESAFEQAWQRIADHFDVLFTTEHSIDQLKQTILQLAVMGKLVPQDPNDEPASVLLEKITAEKEQLVKDGKLKKQKKLASISEDETPFSLPQGWSWARLGDICVLENGDRSKNYPNKSLLVDKGIPFVNAGHLQGGRIDGSEMTFITQERFDLLKAGKFTVGDILFCLRGSLGKSAIVDAISKGAIASSLVIVRLMNNLNRMFIHNYFDSPLSYSQIFRYDNGTAQPNLSAADLGKFLIPLPPEVEQSKIVTKIDELMAICDSLKAGIRESQTTQLHLADAMAEQALS